MWVRTFQTPNVGCWNTLVLLFKWCDLKLGNAPQPMVRHWISHIWRQTQITVLVAYHIYILFIYHFISLWIPHMDPYAFFFGNREPMIYIYIYTWMLVQIGYPNSWMVTTKDRFISVVPQVSNFDPQPCIYIYIYAYVWCDSSPNGIEPTILRNGRYTKIGSWIEKLMTFDYLT
jgi:hypothetical protein